QAPRQWQKKLKETLESLDFRQATSDTAVYHNPTTGVIIITYVDDFLIMGSNKEAIQGYKARLGEIFTMTDLGPASHFLGDAYFTRILGKFGLEECRPVNTPMERNALSTSLPRDDTDSASPNERKDYSSKSGSTMLAKRVLRYLQKTSDHGLVLGSVKKGQVDWKIDLRLASSNRRIYCLLESQKTRNYGPLYDRSRIHCSFPLRHRISLDQKSLLRITTPSQHTNAHSTERRQPGFPKAMQKS
ncbi:unnamed protein product, partial [Fusarium langsethiae]